MSQQAVEVRPTASDAWSEIQYRDYRIELGTQKSQAIPKANINTSGNADVAEGDQIRILVDGSAVFQGIVRSGTYGERGQRRLKCKHPAADLFNDAVTVPVASRSNENHLNEALFQAAEGGDYSLTFNAPTSTFEYGIEEPRKLRRVFRDIVDEQGYIYQVDPVAKEIVVDTAGGSGSWQSFDTASDPISIRQWDPGDLDTVRNAVTVIGTGDEAAEATAEDNTSISKYGRRTGNSPYQYRGVRDQATAQAIAEALLQPEPLANGKLRVPENIATVYESHVNETLTLTDDPRDISSQTVTVTKQRIEPGQTTLEVGEGGESFAIDDTERDSASARDVTRPGSVYGGDRIADQSITDTELVDLSVTEQKLADLAVALEKVQDDAIDTTKVRDDAIETPKLAAGSVIAEKIESDTITANEIAADTITALEIAAGEITANEIASGTITANEIDTLSLDSNVLFISPSTTGSEIQFGLDADFDETAMKPASNDTCQVGTRDDFFNYGYFQNANIPNAFLDTIDLLNEINDRFQIDAGGSFELVFTEDPNSSYNTFKPSGDTYGVLGTGDGSSADDAWGEVHTHNLYEYSPQPLAPDDPRADDGVVSDGGPVVDLEELKQSTWGDPPEYAAQRKRIEGEGYEPLPEREDGTRGVELGHFVNITYEGLKELIRENERLEERVRDLEQRLSRLEAKSDHADPGGNE